MLATRRCRDEVRVPKDEMSRLFDELDLPPDDAPADVVDAAKTLAAALGEGSPIDAAGNMAVVTLQKRPEARRPSRSGLRMRCSPTGSIGPPGCRGSPARIERVGEIVDGDLLRVRPPIGGRQNAEDVAGGGGDLATA
jgi:hypothetical protein